MKLWKTVDLVMRFGGVAASLGLAAQLLAQQPAMFEVATVKRVKSGGELSGGCHGVDMTYPAEIAASAPPIGRCVIRDANLDDLLGIAFELRHLESIKGAPGWAKEGGVQFDVEAKAEDPSKATRAQLYEMLRALVIDRFKIKMHIETTDAPGFGLAVARSGPKLREARSSEIASFQVNSNSRPITLIARRCGMQRLAGFLDLSGIWNGPIADRTGLTGEYDFDLAWDQKNGPSMVTVLRELGLQLKPQRLSASFLVIESAQQPGNN